MTLIVPPLLQVSGWTIQCVVASGPRRRAIGLLLAGKKRFHQEIGESGRIVAEHGNAFPAGPHVDISFSRLGDLHDRPAGSA